MDSRIFGRELEIEIPKMRIELRLQMTDWLQNKTDRPFPQERVFLREICPKLMETIRWQDTRINLQKITILLTSEMTFHRFIQKSDRKNALEFT